jgi:DNA mismatch repair protein MutS
MSTRPPVPLEKLSPMLRLYVQLKEERPDTILFMRVGDFFEAYGEDAETVARELEITLTGRDVQGMDERYPMAGVPHHALERYLARLVQKGYKIAICDQIEDPKQAKGLVKRAVTRVVTPGTLVEDALLDAHSNNFLLAVILKSPSFGIGVVDVSTGEFLVTELDENDPQRLLDEIMRLAPAECLVPEGLDELAQEIARVCPATLTRLAGDALPRRSREALLGHFQVSTLRGFGCDDFTAGLDAAAALLDYVKATHLGAIQHITHLSTYSTGEAMVLDAPARRNLELTVGLYDSSKSKSLLAVLDETRTPMGGRLLKKWLDSPLLSVEKIDERLERVAQLHGQTLLRGDIRDALKPVSDLERLLARLSTGAANARDLVALRTSLEAIPGIQVLAPAPLNEGIEPLPGALELLAAVADEPPLTVREGGLIKDGFDDELDELRQIIKGGKTWIAQMEADERERTGIKSLKVGFNSVFGYFIEVTKANIALVPDAYIRKQTTAQGERFITPELKEMEAKVLGAEEKIHAREFDLFCQVRDEIARGHGAAILSLAQALARLDVFAALAEVAQNNRFVRPTVDGGDVIEIKAGRHPVVEKLMGGSNFIPNDTYLDGAQSQVHIITGPNSAGKSTVLRQVALIVLLAQVGSYVPADYARIGIVDRIFTRVGAHDDLAAGQSTFMVEMTEAAEILNNATERSLVILDEIGRGTSTFDGLSIAWAVAEFLSARGCKTLFATHYHLLNDLEKHLPNVKNFRIAVKETGEQILWLRKVLPGGTDKSYGIQVARMAGLPVSVIDRAREILSDLEKDGNKRKTNAADSKIAARTEKVQLTLFEAEENPVLEELRTLDLDTLTPVEALITLQRLQKSLSIQ